MKQTDTTRQGPLPFLLLLIAAALLLGLSRPANAQAGSILIWPVDPVIEADARATALWLENPGKAPITLQVRIYSWTQNSGNNAYAPQEVILGTPPIVSIAPGARQLVRLTRTAPTSPGREQAFRVVVDEIPTTSPTNGNGAAVSFRMRYSLPLFAYGDGLSHKRVTRPATAARPPRLAWRVVRGGGQEHLEIHNPGVLHARLTDVAFVRSGMSPGDEVSIAKGLFGYVLPDATMRWPLPAGTMTGGELIAAVNGAARARLEPLPD